MLSCERIVNQNIDNEETTASKEVVFTKREFRAYLNLGGPELIDANVVEKFKDNGYLPESELRINIINPNLGQEILKAINDRGVGQMQQIAELTDWTLNIVPSEWSPTGELYHYEVESDQGKCSSIVELVECPGIDEAFNELAEMFPEIEITPPAPYVTLFSKVDK